MYQRCCSATGFSRNIWKKVPDSIPAAARLSSILRDVAWDHYEKDDEYEEDHGDDGDDGNEEDRDNEDKYEDKDKSKWIRMI